MHRVHVDFNAMTNAGVVPGRAPGLDINVGDRVIVFDDETDDYDGTVIAVRGQTLLISVHDAARPA